MSDDSTEDKQFDPSERRLADLRKKGTILRAKDYSGGLMMLTGFIILMSASPYFFNTIFQVFADAYGAISTNVIDEDLVTHVLKKVSMSGFILTLPLGVGLIAVIFLANFLLGGLHFSKDSLKFKGERINLFANLKKMVSLSKLFELIKSILKLCLFFGTYAIFLFYNEVEVVSLSTTKDSHVLIHAFEIVQRFLMYLVPPIILLALVDAVYNYFSFKKKTKMTLKEVKDERKDTEGSPELKQKIRARQNSVAMMNMQRDVPKASVIITNPTHFAVALKYDEKVDDAPKLVAKGADNFAQEIRTLAIKSGVPIYQAPVLARAIYFNNEVGQSIHEELYRAVAVVLVYVSQLQNYQHGLGDMPEPPQEILVPKEYFND